MAKPQREVKEELKAEVKEVRRTRYPEAYKYKSQAKELGLIQTSHMHNGLRIVINVKLTPEQAEDAVKAFDDALAFHKL